MPTLEDAFPAVSSALAIQFGSSQSDQELLDPFEAIISVLLERELGGARVSLALEVLEEAGQLTPDRLAACDVLEIRDALRSHGVSAAAHALAPLKNFSRWIVEHHGGRVEALFNPDRSAEWLRGELAAIPGIGLKAADAIVLFALNRPSYPVDRATFRVFVRHGWLDPGALYDEARDTIVDRAIADGEMLGETARVLIDLSRGMKQLGRQFCRAGGPKCDGCPLEPLLPEGGPREVDG